MKKIILAAFLAFALSNLNAADKQIDTLQVVNKAEENNNLQEPPKLNMYDLINEAKTNLLSRNKEAKVFSATTSVDVSPDDIQYYDFLTSAYNQAVLQIKADIVLKKSGSLAVREAYKYYHKTIPDNLLSAQLEKEVKAKLNNLENQSSTSLFKLAGKLIDKVIESKPENEKKVLREQAQKQIFGKSFSEGVTKSGFDEIAGLVPYENFIVVNKNGEVEIGVLAYVTSKSVQLARDLRQGHKSKMTENKNICKSPIELANSLDKNQLLNKFGLKYFYNQDCRPSLLAFGMDSFIHEEGMNADFRNESAARSEAMAQKFIANFLNSDVRALLEDKKTSQKIVNAMIEASKQDDKITVNGLQKNKDISIIKEMTKELSSSASMDLAGLDTIRTWSEDKGDFEVVGSVVYYTFDNIAKDKNLLNFKKEKQKSKYPTSPNVSHSNNLDIDDF